MGQYIPHQNIVNSYQLADLLLAIEAEMRKLGVWQRAQPEPIRLASKQPFCSDTLSLEEWLQWIFLPRMKDLLEAGKSLPRRCDILPYAQETWQDRLVELARLIKLIEEFDYMIFRLNGSIRH